MSFTESIRVCFQQYNNISGRASRSEFWWFYLFTVLVNLVTSWIPFAGFVVFLVFLLPTIAVTTRRLHDTDRTGWWQLVPLMPVLAGMVLLFLSYFTIFPLGTSITGALIAVLGFFIGFVVLLVFMIQSGTPGPNQYGPNPLEQQQGRGNSGYTQTVNPSRPPPRAGGHDQSAYDVPLPTTEPESGPVERLYCTQCGRQLQAGARFCMACGTAI